MKDMKKMKLAVVFAALMSMLGFTSCLDSDDDPTRYGYEIMKVEGYMGYYTFRNSGGYTVTPTNMSSLSNITFDGPFAWVYYSYDSSLITQGDTNVDAQILGASSIRSGSVMSSTAPQDGGNVPVYEVSNNASTGNVPMCYDQNSLFLPITYYINGASSGSSSLTDEELADLNTHTFTLYYDASGSDASRMTVQLCHNVSDSTIERSKQVAEYRYFNITSVLNEYRQSYGSLPERIRVTFKQALSPNQANTSSGNIEFDFGRYFQNNAN